MDVQKCIASRAAHFLDLPLVLFYRLDADAQRAELVAHTGLAPGGPASPVSVDLAQGEMPWPIAKAASGNHTQRLNDVRTRCGDLVCGPYPEPLASAYVLPLTPVGHALPACVMIAGVSARLPLSDDYTAFYELLAAAVTSVLSSALAREAERRRAEALAEIDRVKTEFFANISHEFRTLLTLILAPLEEELAEPETVLAPTRRVRIETAHRNSLRLLKLVDSLLDFSRVEAGRAQAHYQPTDLAAYTVELASSFRSAVEKGGLSLTVDCRALPEPVYVDREMWEKIVLNLLSNAFKHTFMGDIRVALHKGGDHVALSVIDSGVGIPAAELPRLFERFYRVKGTRARTYEGTGIGLSLVQTLSQLHGGTVSVVSQEGQGSTFTVTVKTGRAHLPAEQVVAPGIAFPTDTHAAAFREEALLWAANAPSVPPTTALLEAAAPAFRPRIVWADDNADMREYVRRLLAAHYEVTAVADGAAAVAAALASTPDLVLTDIMMPVLDGFGVLRTLRADERTRAIPVILLSARAGEEAAISGREAGADDYLVKPFSAKELLARVRTTLELARLRRTAVQEELRRTEQHRADQELLAFAQESRSALMSILEDQQHTEAALRESEERLRLALDAAHMGTFDWDMLTNHITWSRWHEELWGFAPGEFNGTYDAFSSRVHVGDMAAINAEVARCLAKKEPFEREFRVVWPNGSIHWVGARGEFTYGADDQPLRMRGAVIETTEHKRLEQNLQQKNVELERFIYMISHDLKSPLVTISAFLGYLREDMAAANADRIEKDLGFIGSAAEKMNCMLVELLNFSRAGRESGSPIPIAWRDLMKEALAVTAGAIALRGVEVEVADSERILQGDRARFLRIWQNLIENAVKFMGEQSAPRIQIWN